MKFEPLDIYGQMAGACLLIVTTTLGLGAQERYANSVVFQRAHLDGTTGEPVLNAKLWVMEADGSGLRQLTFGTTYDDHPSFYADQEHVLFAVGERRVSDGSERSATVRDRNANAHLVKLNIYTGHRETVAALEGCALHHASR